MLDPNKSGIYGTDEVMKLLDRFGKAPAKVLTKATKAGANLVKTQARQKAPVDTGALKRGIKPKVEKRRTGKKVYRLGFYGKKGDGAEFVRIYGKNKEKRAFYPVSQEYGWRLPSGRKVPEKKFLRNAIDNNRKRVQNIILDTIGRELDKIK